MSKKVQQVDPVTESNQKQNNMAMYTDLMRRAMDHKNYNEALENAYKICEQMNTTNLIPAQYYNLYLVLQQCLSVLDMYLRTDYIADGNDILDLYEEVQTYQCAVARLYLMCIVGSAAVKSKKVGIVVFLKDIIEMSRAVQHPTKGIFLRNYILDCVKSILPSSTTEEPSEGNLINSIEFLLNNFSEMCRLLVRLTQGPQVTEQKVEEQQQLCQVVGKNLMIMSNLDGVSLELYSTNILPRFLEQVLLSRDKVTQDYLYDALIQAFPADYQLATLHLLLHSLGGVVANVGIRRILCSLMERISSYVSANPQIERNMDMFKIFSTHISQIVKTQTLTCEEYVSVYATLAHLVIVWHNEDDAYTQLNAINDNVYDYLTTQQNISIEAANALMSLLQFPFTKYNVLKVIQLRVYPELINLLPYTLRHETHRFVAKKVTEKNHISSTGDIMVLTIRCIETLYQDTKDMTPLNDEELAIDCNLFKTVALSSTVSTESFFDIVREVKNAVKNAGNRRSLMILPTVISMYLRAIPVITDKKDDMFKCVFDILKTLKTLSHFVALKCCVEVGSAAAQAKYSQASYFFETALTMYEDETDIPKEESLKLILSTLASCSLEDDMNEVYIIGCGKFIQLLQDSFQKGKLYCQVSSALFNEQRKVAKQSVSYLQKAVKEAGLCQVAEQNIELLIDILNIYIIHFIRDNSEITAEYINNFANVIKESISQTEIPKLQSYYKETADYIATRTEDKVKQLQL
ncbi:vacuolar protein sorting-associated protein 35, putative [Entamoeba histolytica HM-1:IMSS-B]|uniref:Vacuolar protein sorting 35, putative n=4 Tax=Entamoeba histolytica TaxID=5759 RepID=C4M4G0_ENTH1|nr:vacuolar protein sorting 35, putative [Entamoeba histolytica HM-1:IMSS]EAL51141.1 vacuolar protein sorting 35, putative [Entamoeba histolytica HM-1:IMSS]EMH74383.1 vacuolar protein sorting-associated protein 35, putative [Entamoeba histolytica HM-1:IMSS-B]ENY60492.1 vacuolar protein sorting 35, putative [Entamoeba histolytica HM-1:IMSS-A]GAT96259.1 vacuolar protein sorting-associated protein 35 putative [Entamoeba histolytica]|eukprot:XP_656527.1 vacuolar protein sorting 35, putative [Entamoeba histolytica HM-1:IMSS]